MATKIRVWLDGDHQRIHHAPADQIPDMTAPGADGRTDCGRHGALTLVHHEHVDMGKLCRDCMVVSGVRPALEGQDLGPV